MKKFIVLLVCVVVLLVGDKSGIESSFDPKKAYEQGEAFYNNKEYDKAFEPLKKACDSDIADGCRMLGALYANGIGAEKDLSKAEKLFKKACDGGEMNACRSLGIINRLMAK